VGSTSPWVAGTAPRSSSCRGSKRQHDCGGVIAVGRRAPPQRDAKIVLRPRIESSAQIGGGPPQTVRAEQDATRCSDFNEVKLEIALAEK
jgi:hypothetical protein